MRKFFSVFCAGALSACMILMTLSEASAQAQQRLVPLTRPDGVVLGMPRTEAWRHLGKPNETHLLHLTGHPYTCDYWHDESGSKREMIISSHGRVMQTTQNENDEGRRLITFLFLRRQYPHLTLKLYDLQEEVGSVLVADDVQSGVAWTLYLHHTDDFGTHLLNEVGPDSIIIHSPGSSALPNFGEKLNAHDPLMDNVRTWFAAKPTQTHKGN